MADEQDRAEALDEDKLGEFPPEKPPGAQAYGAAGAEPHADEPVAARAAREEPEEMPSEQPATVADADSKDERIGEEEEGPVRSIRSSDPSAGPFAVLSEDDPTGGDPSLRDVAPEKASVAPAEEAAMHVVDESLGGFDSEVDDPELAAAYEIDPEVER